MDVLVQRPFFRSHSPIGRCTRAYLAYALKEQRLVFFKDTWRVVHKRLIPERQICADLERAEVPFVPGVLCGGDVMLNGEHGKTQCLEWVKKWKDLAVGFHELRDFGAPPRVSRRVRPMVEAFPPVVPHDGNVAHSQHSGSSSPTSATIPGIPPPPHIAFPRVPLLPPASSSVLSGRSVRSKRSIDDIDDDNDANIPAAAQSSTLALRPTKKPRSTSISANAEAGHTKPTKPKKSKKTVKVPVGKTNTIKEVSRPGKPVKKVRSGDLGDGGVVSTRRRGLRSSTAARSASQ
ncbi:hypothetical protein BC835DRAFT_1419028 [Cytidiella melzeri]|nr:hypothetical protein BC835DRAFT_1419028 [Cytidiella melzeri]